jgi:ribosome-interacting GTPase 1
MPANLTPQYFKAEERYKAATDDRERLAALREMLSIVPKHKGTEKLQADIKRRIAQIRTASGKKGGPKRAPAHGVERSGAAQVALVGPANSGKSSFVADLTSAKPEVADFPFTTWTPTPGIVDVDKIPIQLVDLPPINPDHTEPWMVDLLRNADFLLIFMDIGSDEVLDDWEAVVAALESVKISLAPAPPPGERDIGTRHLRSLVAGNKADRPGARTRTELLCEVAGGRNVYPFSLRTGEGLRELLGELVHRLELIRVYTKEPQGEPDYDEPFVIARGGTVEDVARLIHKELAENLKITRAWGERFHPGQPVGKDTALEDGDLLEFHA